MPFILPGIMLAFCSNQLASHVDFSARRPPLIYGRRDAWRKDHVVYVASLTFGQQRHHIA